MRLILPRPRSRRLSGREPPQPSTTEAPIGIFDSGFGGLTVARAVIDQLPHEDIVYLGDTARAPYGEQPIADVREFALECLDHLVDQGVKVLVIACNSGSAAVLRDARERYAVPVVEVILPAARRAVAATRIRPGRGDLHRSDRHLPGVRRRLRRRTAGRAEHGGLSAVRRLRRGRHHRRSRAAGLRRGVPASPCSAAEIDTLILGCTHYPLLTGVISYVLGDRSAWSPAPTSAPRSVFAVLTRRGLDP